MVPQEELDIAQAPILLEGIRALCSPDVIVTLYDDHFNINVNGAESKSRPTSINLKRKSNNFEAEVSSEGNGKSNASGESVKLLKRLKSVGSVGFDIDLVSSFLNKSYKFKAIFNYLFHSHGSLYLSFHLKIQLFVTVIFILTFLIAFWVL